MNPYPYAHIYCSRKYIPLFTTNILMPIFEIIKFLCLIQKYSAQTFFISIMTH